MLPAEILYYGVIFVFKIGYFFHTSQLKGWPISNLSSKTEISASKSKHFVSDIFIELPVDW